jgi:hypothetical protein
MSETRTETCSVCGVKILVGIVGGDRVLYSVGPPATRAQLYGRVCRHVDKPGCINRQAANAPPPPKRYST